jgi:hypothetical protein
MQFDINQVTEGRVNQALNFLSDIDFINIKKQPRGHESEDVITASRAKGRNTPNFKQYFIKKEAELIFSKSEKEQKKLQSKEQL